MSGAPDHVDQIVDSPNPAAITPEQPAAAPADEPARETPAIQPSIREQIAARFKEQRAAETAAFEAPEDEPAAVEDEPTAPAAVVPDTHVIEPPRYRVKVRGNEFEMSREDVLKTAGLSEEEAEGIPMPALLRAAQINAAAQDYLTEAKTALKGSRTAQEPATATPAGDDDADAEPDLTPTKRGAPDPELAEVVQKIQFGDPEDAAAALEQAVGKMFEKRRTAETEQQHRNATEKAVSDFMAANPDIAADPLGTDLLYVSAMHAIKDDLLKLGASPADVEQAVANPAQAVEAHAIARMKGLPVRSPEDILRQAAGRVRQVMPAAGASTTTTATSAAPSRTDVKRSLTPQPRQATVSAAAAPPPAQAKSSSSIVMAMRKSRGQAV